MNLLRGLFATRYRAVAGLYDSRLYRIKGDMFCPTLVNRCEQDRIFGDGMFGEFSDRCLPSMSNLLEILLVYFAAASVSGCSFRWLCTALVL